MGDDDAFFLCALNSYHDKVVRGCGRLTSLITLRRFDKARSFPDINMN
jgi:hypothetical protein